MKRARFFTYSGLVAFLGILLVTAGCQASDVEPNLAMKPIVCELKLDESYPQGAEVLVDFSLNNHSESKFEVLQYHTPLEDLIGPVFEVRFGDQVLAYQGPMVKRGPPTVQDWLQLNPDSVLSNELDIRRAWALDEKGQYSISLSQDVLYRIAGSADVLSLPAGDCATVVFSID